MGMEIENFNSKTKYTSNVSCKSAILKHRNLNNEFDFLKKFHIALFDAY